MISVLQYPKYEVMLRQKSAIVIQASQELINDMIEYQGKCLGLAAVQLGVPVRFIMVKFGAGYIFLANPEVVKASLQMWAYPESCLSIKFGKEQYTFKRPKRVKVKYKDLEGKQRMVKAEGLTARCLQHEIDHLGGILIIDNH